MSDKNEFDVKSKEEGESQQRDEDRKEPEDEEDPFSREKFCDSCSQCASLIKYGPLLAHPVASMGAERKIIFKKAHFEVLYRHFDALVKRPCNCLYRDSTIIECFGLVIRHLIKFSVQQLKSIEHILTPQSCIEKNEENSDNVEEKWNAVETEKLFLFLAKVFIIQFPLYAGTKQACHRFEELSTAEVAQLAVFCEERYFSDFPLALLRNVTLFCKSGGLQGMANTFKLPSKLISPSMVFAIISVFCNIKLWLKYQAVVQLCGPIRSNALHYMCGLSDQELRTKPARDIAEFLWSSVIDDNMDSSILQFDKDGLELALKYFSSPTLTMRLTGIMQMTSQINSLNDICSTDSVVEEVENVSLKLADWILQNHIVEHLFGPNIHVEVIKQSLTLLEFLAVIEKITNDHINIIWKASQLKHCAHQVQDILLNLIKNLKTCRIRHLYELMHALPVRNHTEQTIHLALVLQKILWTTGGVLANNISQVGSLKQQNRMPSKADVLSSSDEEDHLSEDLSAKEQNRALLTKFVRTTSSDCDYSLDDLDDMYDEANPGFTDDELEKEEVDEEDEDDELMTSDEEEEYRRTISIVQSNRVSKLGLKKILPEQNEGYLIGIKNVIPSTSGSKEEGSFQENFQPFVEASGSYVFSSLGKRTKRIPVKGVKRNRWTDSSQSGSEEEEGDHIKISSLPPLDKKGRSEDKGTQGELTLGEEPCLSQRNSQQNVETTMTELANLVNVHPRSARPFGPQAPEVHDMRPVIRSLSNKKGRQSPSDNINASGENESMSSGLSDKNCGDFEVEHSVDEEMLNSARSQKMGDIIKQQEIASLELCHQPRLATGSRPTAQQEKLHIMGLEEPENACERGNTLLWDLLQDGNIEHLADGLVNEAEKALTSLLCCKMERMIKMKFIEGCLNNLARNTSVAISLRLLPKLIQSFQEFKCMETHEICLYVEKRHSMIQLFFNNLKIYSKEHKEGKCLFFDHFVQINIRLQFLTTIFSTQVSPMEMKLTSEQIHILWECLAYDPICSDDLYQYLLLQIHSNEQHAIGLEGFGIIYNEKLPTLNPETISMLGLNLFSQLCQFSNLKRTSKERCSSTDTNLKTNQLWEIALCAQNTDVSMKAIQILNSVMFGEGEEFLITCMRSLKFGLIKLDSERDDILIRIQRALLLLKTYLEMFRRKYAYHLRRMRIEGQGVSTHAELIGFCNAGPINIVVQTASPSDKVTLKMQLADFVADLRAEISAWWEGKMAARSKLNGKGEATGPLLDSMTNDGPLQLIFQGQVLSSEVDEKTLLEMGFKNNQLVLVSQCATRSSKCNSFTHGNIPPFPGRDEMPMNLLLESEHFNLLFSLMKSLGNLRQKNESGELAIIPKAQILSQHVWDILMLLPTNSSIKEFLVNINKTHEEKMKLLFNPEFPQQMMYSFHIVDWLSRPTRVQHHIGIAEQSNQSLQQPWMQRFVAAGGLKHLFDIFLSGKLQIQDSSEWCEWKQDCLSALLKLLVQFGVGLKDYESLTNFLVDQSPRKKLKRPQGPQHNSGDEPMTKKHLLVPRLSHALLQLSHASTVVPRLSSVLLDASRNAHIDASRNKDPSQYRTRLYGRCQVVHFAMSFLLSWLFSVEGIDVFLFETIGFPLWLKNLLLLDPDPSVRQEVCNGVYKMFLGFTSKGTTGVSRINPLLRILIKFLDEALHMTPSIPYHNDDGKEPFGLTCRDYFWILCRLVDNLSSLSNQSEDFTGKVNLDKLSRRLAFGIISRKLYEKHHHEMIPDDVLVGALNLFGSVMKHRPPFKTSNEGKDFILQLWDFLFSLPDPVDKDLPKCKSHISRAACYDVLNEMVKGSLENYLIIHKNLMEQHEASAHLPYTWDYWPQENGRAECGYVGFTNLGATCYLASCMQHLYMIPGVRNCILNSITYKDGAHHATLYELQKMFTYLRDSKKRAYSPLSFCKTYEMDKKTLNIGEQKDMTEFLSDLLSKMEEMTPELKKTVRELFGGTLTNNVVSLDCEHVSSTLEEFYSVRCPVAEKRNLQQSLEEVTVKDTLEGDNMYKCRCGKKVRAEKRACFKRLPKILAFNTLRYTFNFNTMLKEKVNTHFSFPFRLDMSPYMEENLIPGKESRKDNDDITDTQSYKYELIGVTVHTGTADGGHYYSFIRDRIVDKNKWYSFNDADVKDFDPKHIAAECFGGEINRKTYDQVSDKFLDLSIEKMNSAYMVFYERVENDADNDNLSSEMSKPREENAFNLSKDLKEWILKDNRNFVRDNNIFNHAYFNFMWQMVGCVSRTLNEDAPEDITLLSVKLAASFFLGCLIHAKEKLNIVQWVELLTKQFDSSTPACKWFLHHMTSDTSWPITIFLKCQIATIRQMFHRLCIHVIQKLRIIEKDYYLLPWKYKDPGMSQAFEIQSQIGSASSVTCFIKMLFGLLESSSGQPHFKYWTEFFQFLYDFAKLGEEETRLLLSIGAISSLVSFYLKIIKRSPEDTMVDAMPDEDENIIALPVTESNKMGSLDKMIFLIALLVEKSRGDDNKIHLDSADLAALVGSNGKSLVFLFNVTKDNINIHQTSNLIFSLSRNNSEFAEQVTNMVFDGTQNPSYSLHFSRLISFLTEFTNRPSGVPCYTNLFMRRIWELAKHCPLIALEWLCNQVSKNQYVQTALLNTMEDWVETYLIAHQNHKVRNLTGLLVVSLVPSPHFKQAFHPGEALLRPANKEIILKREEVEILHQILKFLFRLLHNAQNHIDIEIHGSGKLAAYFQVITHCLLSWKEKRMFEPYFQNLWNLFHRNLSELSIPIHHNKQALLNMWYTLCVDCPENVQLIHQNPDVNYIAFNYILADHENVEVVNFNRVMLPAYYGILRMCCLQSRPFARFLASHQNIQWAFKNITPFATQYTLACEELFKLMAVFVQKYPDMTLEDEVEVKSFRHQTLKLYLSILDGQTNWSTLINILKVLIATDEDRILVVYNNGLALVSDAINMLHIMFHEAAACHVSGELFKLIGVFHDLLKAIKSQANKAEIPQIWSCWKEIAEMPNRMLTLCNSYTQHSMREACILVVREMLMLWPQEMLNILVPLLHRVHSYSARTEVQGLVGPFFPRRGNLQNLTVKATRPLRPMIQMFVPNSQVEAPHGQDVEYDKALHRYFHQYHMLIDLMVRIAVNENNLSKMLMELSVMVGLDGVLLHFQLFPKLWMDVYNIQKIDSEFIAMFLQSQGFLEFVDLVLRNERSSLSNQYMYQLLDTFFPKVSEQVLTESLKKTLCGVNEQLIGMAEKFALPRPGPLKSLNGDLRALCIVNSAQPLHPAPALLKALITLRNRIEKAKGDLDEEFEIKEEDEKEAMDCNEEQQEAMNSNPQDIKLKLKEAYDMLSDTLKLLIDLNQKHCGIQETQGSSEPKQDEI